MKHYYMTFCNDDVELFGTECRSRADAIKELKEAFRADCAELEGENPFDYYIKEYWETETTCYCSDQVNYSLTLGKRGGVTCKRI